MRSKVEVETGLTGKGFRQSNSHHRFFVYYTIQGVKSRIRTKTSHGGKDIGKSLLAQMAKQCALPTGEFLRLVDCPLSRAEYETRVSAHL